MNGVVIDFVLGAIVFTAVMVAFQRQRQDQPAPLILSDELLHTMTVNMKRFEQSAQSVGEASVRAAKAFQKFGEAMEEFNRRQWVERTRG